MSSGPGPARAAFRLDVNAAVEVQFDELGRKMNMMLVDLSGGGCRLRAGVSIPANTKLSFAWAGPSRKPLRLNGVIVGAKMADPKTAEYGIKFEMPVAQRDALAAELQEIQRRQVYKEAAPVHIAVDDSLGGRAKRQAYRANVQFPVSVRAIVDKRETQFAGIANDLSEGGVMLIVPKELEEGADVVVRFTLPNGAVDLSGEEREVVETGPFGERKVKKNVPMRPFESVEARAKIMKVLGPGSSGGFSHGTAFQQLSPFVREEIARFVHAYQVTQLRKSAATK